MHQAECPWVGTSRRGRRVATRPPVVGEGTAPSAGGRGRAAPQGAFPRVCRAPARGSRAPGDAPRPPAPRSGCAKAPGEPARVLLGHRLLTFQLKHFQFEIILYGSGRTAQRAGSGAVRRRAVRRRAAGLRRSAASAALPVSLTRCLRVFSPLPSLRQRDGVRQTREGAAGSLGLDAPLRARSGPPRSEDLCPRPATVALAPRPPATAPARHRVPGPAARAGSAAALPAPWSRPSARGPLRGRRRTGVSLGSGRGPGGSVASSPPARGGDRWGWSAGARPARGSGPAGRAGRALPAPDWNDCRSSLSPQGRTRRGFCGSGGRRSAAEGSRAPAGRGTG